MVRLCPWVQPSEVSLPSQPRSKRPSLLPSLRERPPRRQGGKSDLPTPIHRPGQARPRHTVQASSTERKGSLQSSQLSAAASGQLWASLLLSLAGHEGSSWYKLLSQTLDHSKTLLKVLMPGLKTPLKTELDCARSLPLHGGHLYYCCGYIGVSPSPLQKESAL